MKFIIFSSVFLFSIISKASSYSSSYNSSFERRLSTQSKNPLENRNQKRYSNSTALTSTGKGSILKLADHKIECPKGQALNAIHMWGKWSAFSDNKFAYEFHCLPSKSLGQEINKKTKEVSINKDPTDSVFSLDNLAINCDKDSVLRKVQMANSKDNKKVWYTYTCVKASVKSCQKKAIKEMNIKENFVGKKVINQLSQFHIDADPNTFLQTVNFVGPKNKSNGKYEYTFCILNSNKNVQNNQNPIPEDQADSQPNRNSQQNNPKQKQVPGAPQRSNNSFNNKNPQNQTNNTNGNNTIQQQANQPRPYFRKRLRRRKVNQPGQTKAPVGHNKKIPIQQNSAENFCKTKCVQGNQTKKCYINGNVGQCSSCKFGGQLNGPKEHKIQKICFQLCNFIPSQGTCKSFAYVLKLKVDSKLLEEFGLKRKL